MDKLKIAVIGCGNIAMSHLTAYKANPNVEIYALCDLDERILTDRAEKFGVTRTFTDYHEMLALDKIDAVSVCTWNAAHAECAIAALKAGKHVLCEKPMAMNGEQARQMKAAAEESGKLLMIGFVRRFGNDTAILRDMIDNDQFGEIYYAKATYLRRHGNPGGWFGDKARSGGGPLIDLGVHVIDLTRYLLGNPKPISVYGATFQKLLDRPAVKDKRPYIAASAKEGDPCNVEDLASAMIRYENGTVVTVEASFSLNIKKPVGRIDLFGTKAGAKLEPELEMYTDLNGYMADVTFDSPTSLSFEGLFENEINHFVDCIRFGIPCISPADDGVAMMDILDAIYRSAQTGHEVIL